MLVDRQIRPACVLRGRSALKLNTFAARRVADAINRTDNYLSTEYEKDIEHASDRPPFDGVGMQQKRQGCACY